MLYSTLLAVAAAAPQTPEWSWKVGLVMCLANAFAIAIGRFTIQNAGASGLRLPGQLPAIWNRFGIPELLGTMSLGHVLGAGLILGLGSSGAL